MPAFPDEAGARLRCQCDLAQTNWTAEEGSDSDIVSFCSRAREPNSLQVLDEIEDRLTRSIQE